MQTLKIDDHTSRTIMTCCATAWWSTTRFTLRAEAGDGTLKRSGARVCRQQPRDFPLTVCGFGVPSLPLVAVFFAHFFVDRAQFPETRIDARLLVKIAIAAFLRQHQLLDSRRNVAEPVLRFRERAVLLQ